MNKNKKNVFLRMVFYSAVILAVLFLVFYLNLNPAFFQNVVKNYGLLGIFIGAIIANSTIFLPLPIDVLVVLVGANPQMIGFAGFGFFEMVVLAAVVAFGAAIGEMVSYIVGFTGIKIAEQASKKEFRHLDSIKEKLEKHGVLFIFFASLMPFPFDIVGITCGIIQYDFRKVFIAIFLGRFLRYFFIAFAANSGINFLSVFGR